MVEGRLLYTSAWSLTQSLSPLPLSFFKFYYSAQRKQWVGNLAISDPVVVMVAARVLTQISVLNSHLHRKIRHSNHWQPACRRRRPTHDKNNFNPTIQNSVNLPVQMLLPMQTILSEIVPLIFCIWLIVLIWNLGPGCHAQVQATKLLYGSLSHHHCRLIWTVVCSFCFLHCLKARFSF